MMRGQLGLNARMIGDIDANLQALSRFEAVRRAEFVDGDDVAGSYTVALGDAA